MEVIGDFNKGNFSGVGVRKPNWSECDQQRMIKIKLEAGSIDLQVRLQVKFLKKSISITQEFLRNVEFRSHPKSTQAGTL